MVDPEVKVNSYLSVEERLQRIEYKFDQFTSRMVESRDDKVDLLELGAVIWNGKISIILITAIFSIVAIIYALSLPNMYKSQIVLVSTKETSGDGMGGLAAQYGGLAAIAGINLGGSNGRIDQAIELVKSWPFLESFIDKYQLMPQIMAVDGWSQNTNKLIYDYDVYDPEKKVWVSDKELEIGKNAGPSSFDAYKALKKMLTVSKDKNTGMLEIGVEHYSPQIAFEWTVQLKQELNDYYQTQDMVEAEKNIEYLRNKIVETNVADMRAVFYSMIENQTRTLMLAKVSEQYLVKTVVPAKIAEVKSTPERALICVWGMFLGGVFSILFVLIRYFTKKA